MVHVERELSFLKNTLLTMASHAESAVNRAIEALTTRNLELALRVKDDDEIIDRFEVEIDDLAIHLLAKAPLASDLRLIAVAMKISQNIERVGDEATKIAKRARDLSQEAPLKLMPDVPHLADLALQMVKGALDAFVNQDPAAARALIPQDRTVDDLNKQLHRQLADQMIASPETITRCLSWMVVAKSLERIADHGKNIAEEVVYLCEAQDIRHSGKSKMEILEGPGQNC
jgi:phosphate transport system protein